MLPGVKFTILLCKEIVEVVIKIIRTKTNLFRKKRPSCHVKHVVSGFLYETKTARPNTSEKNKLNFVILIKKVTRKMMI